MNKFPRLVILLAFLSILSIGAAKAPKTASAAAAAPPAMHVALKPSAIQWGDAPPILPKGAKLAVLAGDPFKSEMFVVRLRMPNGYRIAPHWHPTRENVTVISGTFHIAMGDKFDPSKGDTLPAGGFTFMDARMNHYAWSDGATEVEITGMGPFQVNYVNPKDDPTRIAKK